MTSTAQRLNPDKITPFYSAAYPARPGRAPHTARSSVTVWLMRGAICLSLIMAGSAAAPRLAAQQPAATNTARAATHVSGLVRTTDGAPVAGVGIQLAGTAYRAITTDSGAFDLTDVAPGSYTLVARGPAKIGARVRVTATAGQVTTVDLVLVAGGATPTNASGAETLAEVKVQGQRAVAAEYGPGSLRRPGAISTRSPQPPSRISR